MLFPESSINMALALQQQRLLQEPNNESAVFSTLLDARDAFTVQVRLPAQAGTFSSGTVSATLTTLQESRERFQRALSAAYDDAQAQIDRYDARIVQLTGSHYQDITQAQALLHQLTGDGAAVEADRKAIEDDLEQLNGEDEAYRKALAAFEASSHGQPSLIVSGLVIRVRRSQRQHRRLAQALKRRCARRTVAIVRLANAVALVDEALDFVVRAQQELAAARQHLGEERRRAGL